MSGNFISNMYLISVKKETPGMYNKQKLSGTYDCDQIFKQIRRLFAINFI